MCARSKEPHDDVGGWTGQKHERLRAYDNKRNTDDTDDTDLKG